MPKRNPSGPSSGKRRSSTGSRPSGTRSSSSQKKSSTRFDSNRSDRSDRKSSSGSFKKFDSAGPKKSFRKTSEGSDERNFDKGPGKRSFNKPFKKFNTDDSKKSFGRKSEGSDERSFDKRPGKKSFDKPFKKFNSTDSAKKSFRGKSEGSDRREFGRGTDNKKFDKPFRKSDDADSKKPFRKRAGGFTESGSSSDNKKPFKKPYRSFDKKDSDEKPRTFGKSSPRSDDRSDDRERNFKKERPRKSFREKAEDYASEAPAQTEKIRLNRYIANSGVCSRREADNLITMGLISVNGKTVTELGFKVNPGDEVRYESKVLRAEKPVYVLLNKPKGFLTTTSDPQERNTVMHLLGNHIKERIYPVGRLDRNTTGLLLLTNDGDLADKLMHPSYNVKKIYKVELDRPLTKADYQKIREGVRLEEGVAQVDDLAIVSDNSKTVGIELHIGWNRVVRRIFESLEYEVIKLDRSVYAGLDKKDLGRGEWRFLKKEEIVRLKHYK